MRTLFSASGIPERFREVTAMSKLETMYNKWTWELRSHVLSLQDQLINQIQNGKIHTLEAHTLAAPVTDKYEAIKQELEKYFNEDPDSEVLVQWKGNFENKLMILKESLISDSQRKAKEFICFKKKIKKTWTTKNQVMKRNYWKKAEIWLYL